MVTGQSIRDRRVSFGLSVSESAREAGVGRQTWVRLESTPNHSPRPDVLAKVTAVLRWPLDALDRIEAGENPAVLPTLCQMPDASSTVKTSSDSLLAALARLPEVDRLTFEAEILEAAAEFVRSQIPPDQ